MDTPALETLLAPEAIAIVGASPDAWYASNLIEHLQTYGYTGSLYYVNPSRERVFGEPCYDSISDVPTVVDLAVISVPREYVVETVREAGAMGVPSALIITAGFSEADDEGTALEAELEAAVEETGITVCGPNTIGFANTHAQTVASAVCSRQPEPGSIGLVSQSGALAFATFFDRGADEDLAFAYVIATGNEVDLSVTDYVEYLADDERVDVICLYVEGIERPRRFVDVATQAIQNGTPVLAVKVGQSAVAKEASLSHTGSIAGDEAAWEAAFKRAGIERVPDIPDLLHRAQAHARLDPADSNNVCIASTSGGLATLLADLAAERGLALPPIEGATEERLLAMEELLTFGSVHNPADIRGYGADVLEEIADILFADDRFDAYVFAVALSAVDEDAADIAAQMRAIQERATDPVVFLWTGRKAPTSDSDEPLPFETVREEAALYYDPATCLDAVASLVKAGQPVPETPALTDTSDISREMPSVPSDTVLTWQEAEALLEAVGIDLVETVHAADAATATAYATERDTEVVLKVDSRAIPHRTDAGAVAVGVSPGAVESQFEQVIANATAHAPEADIEGVLVQPLIDPADKTEVLVGVHRDSGFGPVLTVAPGGTAVETVGADASVTLLPPVDAETVAQRLHESTIGARITDDRGQPAGDLDALADLIARVGRLVTADDAPPIAELDLNPVFVGPEGVTVVDALIRTGKGV